MSNQPTEFYTTTDLPPKRQVGRGRSKFYTTIAQEAVKNPAVYIAVPGFKSTAVASNMRRGRYPSIDPRDYEIEMRKDPDGTYTLYIKYVGKIVEQ